MRDLFGRWAYDAGVARALTNTRTALGRGDARILGRVGEKTDMTPKERIHATIRGESYDRPAVTPIFMAWAGHFIGRTYRDYYLDGDVLAESQLAVTQAFGLDQISAISDPWRETGGDLREVHTGMNISEEEFVASVDDLMMVLGKNNVGEREQQEVLFIFFSLKGEVLRI